MPTTRATLLGFALIFAGLALLACGPDCVAPLETRCQGEVAQICRADHTWGTVEDCAQTSTLTGSAWACCYFTGDVTLDLPAGHTCLPADVCSHD